MTQRSAEQLGPPAIAIHGGAGTIRRQDMSPELDRDYRAALEQSLRAGHAVLMVRTDRGDFILDNKTNAVLPWSDTAYDCHKREGAEGLAWVVLSHQRAPVVTAAKAATSLPAH